MRGATLRTCVVALVALGAASCGIAPPDRLAAGADVCLGGTGPAALTTMFDSEPGAVTAADYQRAVDLPDGRTLWLFQDATIRLPEPPPETTTTTTTTTTVAGQAPTDPPPPPPTEALLHNIAMLQTGTCFEVLRSGTEADPGPWLFADQTTPLGHWFWALDATMGDDGRLYVFVAEMVERSDRYLGRSEPISTRIVGVDVATMQPTFFGEPPNAGPALYGFSIASDDRWTYLYAHCHRQFGFDVGPFGVAAHDRSCAAELTVARIPLGRPFDTPTYWNGAAWHPDAAQAVGVLSTDDRTINPGQVRWNGSEFVAVTKVGDWFGDTLYLDRAPAAHGPWTTYARIPTAPKCSPTVCNTYFASWVPGAEVGSDRYVVGLSHNRWDGTLSTVNRPTYFTVPTPGTHARASRCAVVTC